jgi:hypothetical protein
VISRATSSTAILQRGGYILRPGCSGCPTSSNPVPSQAGHICSVGFAGGFFIRTFHVARRPARPH